ncbi:AraC family transcriptional regulator, partial [Streptomyces sp. SID7982]|nr:AraC family transcriptional regulator [Streptomyces sp. SID7982]
MTRETRTLPAFAPGSVETPFVIKDYGEVVSHDTHWDAHSHPFH